MSQTPSSTDILENMMGQVMPDQYDPNESMMDNAYRFIGYDNPVSEVLGPEDVAPASLLDPNATDYSDEEKLEHDLWESLYRDAKASEDSRSRIMPAAVRAYAATENFGDNIGTAIQVESAYWLNKLGVDWFTRAMATDIQYGISAYSDRGGVMGLYGDIISPEEMYGEGWQALSRDELYARRKTFHAKQIEEYYSGVLDNAIGDGIGSVGSHILDVANLAPTGYLRAASLGQKMGMGKLAAHTTAGAITGALWGGTATSLDMYIQGEAMDSNRLLSGAVLAGGVGALLPLVGHTLNGIIGRATKNGQALSLDDVQFKIDQTDEILQKMKKHAESHPVPKTDKDKAEAASILEELNTRIEANKRLNPVELQQRVNDTFRKGADTDAAEVIDTALRMHNGKSVKDLQSLSFFDTLYRKSSIEDVKKTAEYAKLDDESKAIVDKHIEKRQGKSKGKSKPKKLKEAELQKQREISASKAEEETNELMSVVGSFAKPYTQDVLRQVRNSTGGAAIGYGGAYVVTDDPEFALYTALAMGSLPLASKMGTKLLGFGSSRAKDMLLSNNTATRKQGADILRSSWWKGTYAGTNGFTNNNLTTTPWRGWMNRGGTARAFGEKLRRAQEDSNTSIAVRKVEFRSLMSELGIKPGEGELVAKLMAKTIDDTHPLVMPRHVEAAQRMRKLYNKELDDLVKVGVLTKAEAKAMKDTAKAEGYLNRIYYTDYLSTPKGAKAFQEAMAKVDMSDDDAAAIISALTGARRTEALKKLREYSTKDGKGFNTFTYEGIRKMMKQSLTEGAQPSKFIERERKLPTKLEKVLEPFLVRDLDTAYTKYIESASRRREYARQFGPNGDIARGYAEKIGAEWDSDKVAQLAMQDYYGATFDPRNKWLSDMFNQSQAMRSTDLAVQHFQNSKLVASAPINFTQHLVYLPTYMSKMGLTSKIPTTMYKAYRDSMQEILEEVRLRGKVEGRGFLNTIGSMTDMMTYSATGEVIASEGGAKLGMWKRMSLDPGMWLKAGFSQAENWNRRVSGIAGKYIVEDTLNRYKALSKLTRLSNKQQLELADVKSRMVDLGLDPTIKEGDLTIAAVQDAGDYVGGILRDWREPEAIAAGAQRISNEVNFKSDYMNKPRWWSHPIGKWFGKFRSFVLHSQHFITDNVVKPINEGNTMPLAVFLTAGGAMMPIAEIKEVLKNDDIERSNLDRLLNSYAKVGTTGLLGEGVTQIRDYPESVGQFILGPVLSDTIKLSAKLSTGVNTGDVEKLAIDLAKMVGPLPYATGVVSRALGEDNPLATQQERTMQERARDMGVSQLKGIEGYGGI